MLSHTELVAIRQRTGRRHNVAGTVVHSHGIVDIGSDRVVIRVAGIIDGPEVAKISEGTVYRRSFYDEIRVRAVIDAGYTSARVGIPVEADALAIIVVIAKELEDIYICRWLEYLRGIDMLLITDVCRQRKGHDATCRWQDLVPVLILAKSWNVLTGTHLSKVPAIDTAESRPENDRV